MFDVHNGSDRDVDERDGNGDDNRRDRDKKQWQRGMLTLNSKQLADKKSEMKNKVKNWLFSLMLNDYYDNFITNGYDRFESCILSMNKDDLTQIGIKLGHVKIIQESIDQMKFDQDKAKMKYNISSNNIYNPIHTEEHCEFVLYFVASLIFIVIVAYIC